MEVLPVQTMNMLTTEQLKAAWARSEPVNFGDPYLARIELQFQDIFYPLGFPVLLATNSAQAFDSAAERWRHFERLFDVEPIKLTIGVTDGGSTACPPTPNSRMRGHLNCNIADADNFSIADYDQAFTLTWVTRATLEYCSYFRYFFLDCAAMSQIANRYAWGIHAACMELDGAGVMLCGDSGAGKSTLSFALARAGWTYVTDDGGFLVDGRDDRLIVGNCSQLRFRPASESIFPELGGRQVMQRAELGKPSIEFATASAPQFKTSPATRIRHVVFLNRNDPRHEMVPFPTEVARLYLLQRASLVPELRERQTRMFDRLLEVGAFELCYTDLDWAIQRLSQLVREGR
jgi:hypothetical protein